MLKSGYVGKKNGAGFYNYKPRLIDRLRAGVFETSAPVNPRIYDFFDRGCTKGICVSQRSSDFSQIQRRLVYLMVNEAALCLQQGTISSPEDGDIGAVFGLGFPPFLGGPFRYLDSEGIASIVSEMENLSSTCGPRFEPASILLHMARHEEKFYSQD